MLHSYEISAIYSGIKFICSALKEHNFWDSLPNSTITHLEFEKQDFQQDINVLHDNNFYHEKL